MTFVTHKIDHTAEKSQAHALRRCVRDRAAGRKASEYVYPLAHGGDFAAWAGCSEAEHHKHENSRRFRKPGPWCEVLGHDTRISSDHALMAFLEMRSCDDLQGAAHEWGNSLREVTSNRVKALRRYRAEGMEILSRQSRRHSLAVSAANAKGQVSLKYLKRGEGVRPLKIARTAI